MAGRGGARRVQRILVEPSAYHLLNLGDVAMLQVAVCRLSALWPSARIDVFTDVPDRLARLCPGADPVPAEGRNAYLNPLPPGDWLWRRLPQSTRRLARSARLALRDRTGRGSAMRLFANALAEADLIVVSGGGGTADVFPWETRTVLELLELGVAARVPTALMGQAFGPLQDPSLRRHAGAVLRHVDLIALREQRASAPLLESLGVPMHRVVTTGDDAIAVASPFRTDDAPDAVMGVNLRIAPYSGLDPSLAAEAGRQIAAAAGRHHARMVATPVSIHPDEADADVAARAVGTHVEDAGTVDGPEDVLARIARCRIVVTGSYHAAVFALALGIPAVGLALSPYYVDKFSGLADQFGPGCAVVRLDGSWPATLADAIDSLWGQAEDLRTPLRERADEQVAQAEAAYRRLRDLVDGR
ncbi:MAG: polysaccharide pyruvyl transferase family protein [Acidimicrobiia bacterium]